NPQTRAGSLAIYQALDHRAGIRAQAVRHLARHLPARNGLVDLLVLLGDERLDKLVATDAVGSGDLGQRFAALQLLVELVLGQAQELCRAGEGAGDANLERTATGGADVDDARLALLDRAFELGGLFGGEPAGLHLLVDLLERSLLHRGLELRAVDSEDLGDARQIGPGRGRERHLREGDADHDGGERQRGDARAGERQ